MGAVLSQIDEDGKEYPVSYASRTCNPADKNYGSCEGECLAVVWATQHFREYLFGTPFTLITDHEPLKWLMKTNKTTGKLARWSLLLQEYDMKVIHKRGIMNTNADCLSRFPKNALDNEPPLPDWSKGDYNQTPQSVFAFMDNFVRYVLQHNLYIKLVLLTFRCPKLPIRFDGNSWCVRERFWFCV